MQGKDLGQFFAYRQVEYYATVALYIKHKSGNWKLKFSRMDTVGQNNLFVITDYSLKQRVTFLEFTVHPFKSLCKILTGMANDNTTRSVLFI